MRRPSWDEQQKRRGECCDAMRTTGREREQLWLAGIAVVRVLGASICATSLTAAHRDTHDKHEQHDRYCDHDYYDSCAHRQHHHGHTLIGRV